MEIEFEIKCRITGKSLWKCMAETLKEAVIAAVKKRAYLQGADLQGADLQGADLRGAYLRSADLQDADLRGADLRGAYLRGAYLQDADLRGAYLQDADLRGAYLHGADLQGADLQGADLRGAYLRGAYLRGADLQDADLRGAYLQDADLRGAYLQGADLQGADLQGADLRGAYLRGADGVNLSCPEEGAFIAWKKCLQGVLVKLQIPAEARRCSATGRKCRAEFATVIEVIGAECGVSSHDGTTTYRAGETVRCDKWEEDRWIECGGGIHFFITRKEAEEY